MEPQICPWCASAEAVPIVYGFPGEELEEAARQGEVSIGGCVIWEDPPTEACRSCGTQFHLGTGELVVHEVPRPWRRAVTAPFEVLGDGRLPVVVHVPHAGLHVPEDVRAGIVLGDAALAAEQRAITDHRTDVLAQGAIDAGAHALANRLSRLVVDPERFPDPAEEVMASVGMAAVYTGTTELGSLRHPSDAEQADLLARFFDPYAEAVAALVDRTLDRHGRCVIVDLHSYPAVRLPYELGDLERPEVCVGVDPRATPAALARLVEQTAADHGLGAARNTPFAGTYVPLRHLDDPRVTSVMLEVRRDTYLDGEPAWPGRSLGWVRPSDGEPRVQAFVTDVVLAAAELA